MRPNFEGKWNGKSAKIYSENVCGTKRVHIRAGDNERVLNGAKIQKAAKQIRTRTNPTNPGPEPNYFKAKWQAWSVKLRHKLPISICVSLYSPLF